jgi:predicted phosphodiesterase
LKRTGFHIVIAYGHGPSNKIIRKYKEEWQYKFNLQLFSVNEGMNSPDPKKEKCFQCDHAAKSETSIIMALRPDLVKMDNLPADTSIKLIGVSGIDPRLEARKKVGEKIISFQVNRWVNKKFIANIIILLIILTGLLFLLYYNIFRKQIPSIVDQNNHFLIVHMTDLHISSQNIKSVPTPDIKKFFLTRYKLHHLDLYHNKKNLTKAIDHINNTIKPDLVLITGDIVNFRNDTHAYFWAYNELIRLNYPWFPVAGDHDITEGGLKNNDQVWFETRPFSRTIQNYRIIGLPPFMDDKSFIWLRNELDNSKNFQVIIFQHRMMKATWIMNLLTKIYCSSLTAPRADELFELFDQYQNIRIVLCGHSHINYSFKRNDTCYLTTSSLAEFPFEFRLIWIGDDNLKTKIYSVYPENEKIP